MYFETARETKQFINEPYTIFEDQPHNLAWFVNRIIRTHIRSVIEMCLIHGKSIQYTHIDNSDKFMYSIDDQYKNKLQSNCIVNNDNNTYYLYTMYNNYDSQVSELIQTLSNAFSNMYENIIPDDVVNELLHAGYSVTYSDNRKTIAIGFRE